VALLHGVLSWTQGDETVWSIPLGAVRVIGEYTTTGGPGLDDYFIVFVAAAPLRVFAAPIEAGGSVLPELSVALNFELRCGLANRVDFSSRILWPQQLVDHPLLDFGLSRCGAGVWAFVKDAVMPVVNGEVTEEVRRYVQRSAEPALAADARKDARG